MELIWAVVVAAVVFAVGIASSAIAGRLAPLRRPRSRTVDAVHGAARISLPPSGAPSPVVEAPAAAGLRLARLDELDEAGQQALLELFDRLPQPPRLLAALASRDALHRPAALAELVAGEPLIASRVLLAATSPLHGAAHAVTSIGEAIELLGADVVRVTAMRQLLQHSLKADHPARGALLDATWTASALAGEIGDAALRRIGIADVGRGAGELLLSFVGKLAVAAAVPRSTLGLIPERGFAERTRAEQERLGVCAAEIGRLLLGRWGLPRELVEHVADIDRVLVTPRDPALAGPERVHLAFAYLCARLGERLAFAELSELARFDLATDTDPALAPVRSDLEDPAFARLVEQLRSGDVSAHAALVLRQLRPQPAPAA